MDAKKTERLVINIGAMVAATLLPGFALAVMGFTELAGTAGLVAMSVYVAAIFGGRKLAVSMLVPFAVAAGLAVWWSDNPWLAALLMLVVAGTRGMMAQYGMHGPLSMSVIAIGFILAEPPKPSMQGPAALLVGILVLIVGGYAVLTVIAFRRWMPTPKIQEVPPMRANYFGLILGVTVAVAAWFTVQYQLSHEGAWIMLTIVVVLQPNGKDAFKKAFQRSVGTTLGFLIAIGLATTVDQSWFLYLIGIVAMVAAMAYLMLKKPYWEYAILLTVGIVILEGSSTSIVNTANTRFHATIIGATAALAVTLAMAPFGRWVNGHEIPETAEPVESELSTG